MKRKDYKHLLDLPGSPCICGCGGTVPIRGAYSQNLQLLSELTWEDLCWLSGMTERGFRIDGHLNIYDGPDEGPILGLGERFLAFCSRIRHAPDYNDMSVVPVGHMNWHAAHGSAPLNTRPRATSTGSGSGF